MKQQLDLRTNPPTHRVTPATSPARIVVFITAVLGLGWLGPLVDHTAGHGLGEGPGQLIWILLPVGAAMILRWKGGDGFADAALRPRHRENRPWYLFSGGFYPVVMIAAAGGGLLAGDWELDNNVLVQNEPTPWIFSPGIDSAVVIAITGLVAALFFRQLPHHINPTSPTISTTR